jgi:hypothetical protein
VFLIIAVLLIAGGMITCSVAEDIALTDNFALFHTSEDCGTYVRENFDASKIRKIELLITDAEINIISGADEAYVEFINFRDGLFTLSNSGELISMDEIPDIKSLFNLQSGFSFSGMRYILSTGTFSLGEKKINVYLPQETELKQISVEANNCVLNAEKVFNKFDLVIHADDHASLNLSEFRTACKLEVEAKSAELHVNSSYLDAAELNVNTIEAELNEMYWDHMTLDLQQGTMNVTSTVGLHRYAYDLKGKGTVTVNGENLELPYTLGETGSVDIPYISGEIGRAEIVMNEIID